MENRLNQSAELRKRAESILEETLPSVNIANLSPEKLQKTVHELQVHQIELEMQNEELRRTQAKLDVSHARYFDFYNLAPVGYLTISSEGLILEANLTAASLLGAARSALVNQPITHFILKEDQDLYYLYSNNQFKTNEPQECDVRMAREDGSMFWVRLRTITAQDSDGTPVCRVVMSDITEHKRAEEALRESKAQLEAALASMTDAVFISDVQGQFLNFNDAFATFHKFKSKDECAKNLAEYPDILDVFMANGEPAPLDMWAVPRALRGEVATNVEYKLRRKDSGETWVGSYSFGPIRDANGSIVGSVVSGRDITKLKQVEATLKESEERFRLLFENHTAVKLVINAETGHIVDANNAAVLFYGWPKEQLTRMSIEQINTLNVDIVKDEMEKAFKFEKLRFEFSHRIADGSIRDVEVFSNNIEISGKHFLYSIIHDITDRKMEEKALREREADQRKQEVLRISEARFREVLEHSLDASYKRNLQTESYEYLSPVFTQISGYTPEEVIALPTESVLRLMHLDDLPGIKQALSSAMSDSTEKAYSLEYRFKHKDGQYRWFHDRFTVMRDEAGHPIARIGSVSDITDRKFAEEKLQKTMREQQTILDTANVGISMMVDRKQLWVNQKAVDLFQYSKEEMEGQSTRRLYPTQEAYDQLGMDAYPSLSLGHLYVTEQQLIRRDGTPIWVKYNGRAIEPNDLSKGTIWILEDVTDRKQAEELILESRENYHRVFENKMIAICIFDAETFLLLDVNDTFAQLNGYSREELIGGMRATDLSAEPYLPLEAMHSAKLFKPFSIAARNIKKKDGTIVPVEIVGDTYMRDGRQVILAMLQDISQRKRVEEELSEIHGELEQKVLERTADLEKTNATLAMMLDYARKTETDIQERVVSNLRTNILGIVDVLKKQQLAKSTQDLVELLETTTLNLAHPIARNLESQLLKLTVREIQLANFIRLGKSTKELVELLNVSKKTVESHRNNLRIKLGLSNKKINLRTFLNSEFAK